MDKSQGYSKAEYQFFEKLFKVYDFDISGGLIKNMLDPKLKQ